MLNKIHNHLLKQFDYFTIDLYYRIDLSYRKIFMNEEQPKILLHIC